MPLKKCSGCGAQISTAAKACPQCGQPSLSSALGQAGGAMMGCGCLLILLSGLILIPLILAAL